jgi:hypothetical protein
LGAAVFFLGYSERFSPIRQTQAACSRLAWLRQSCTLLENNQVPDRLLDAVFIVVGFYFGGAIGKKPIDEAAREDSAPTEP